MINMLLIIVKNNINIQIFYVTHLPYLKHILWHFINVCTYSQLLTTQELSFIIKDKNNKVKMHSHCTIDYYYRVTQTCHGIGSFTSVINPLHITHYTFI